MEQIIKDNKIYRFNLELKHITDERRKHTIKNIIDNLKNPKSIPNNLERFNLMLDKIDTVKVKKPFYRLNAFQKESIIKDLESLKNVVLSFWNSFCASIISQEFNIDEIYSQKIYYNIHFANSF